MIVDLADENMKNIKRILLYLAWYDYRIHQGVATVARENGWHLICPKGEDEKLRLAKDWKGDGCIALTSSQKILQKFVDEEIPTIELGISSPEPIVPRVVTDNMEIGRLAATHFLDHGYSRVMVLQPGGIHMFKDRLASLKHHLKAKGGEVKVLPSTRASGDRALGLLKDLVTESRATLEESSLAFFAYEDNQGADLITSCLENGFLVPENIAVLGVDNDQLINEGLATGLSSIESDQEGLGRSGAEVLKDLMLDRTSVPRKTLIKHPPKGIVVRKSTDCFAVRSPVVAKALNWIQNHYHEGIQAVDVARAMSITQQGLMKAFKLSHTRSLGEEIRYQRTHAVANILRTESANLSQIAERCGYWNVDTLIANFREEFETTPGKYRKEKGVGSGKP